MTSGCPVGVVNVGAIAEVCWEAAVLFDPKDPAAIANAAREALALADGCTTSPSLRAARFMWEKWPGSAMPSTGRSLQTGL